VVFNAAAVAVVFDTVSNTQKFYTEHTDDIVSMAMHPKGEIFATGQVTSTKGSKSPGKYSFL
jgi:hypothetical protein